MAQQRTTLTGYRIKRPCGDLGEWPLRSDSGSCPAMEKDPALDVAMAGTDPTDTPEVIEKTLTVNPTLITMDNDTLLQPGSSLFDQIDNETLPHPLKESTAMQASTEPLDSNMSENLDTEDVDSDVNVNDEGRVPFETFDYTEPKRNTLTQIVIPQPKLAALPYSSLQSGVVYDPRMRFHTEIIDTNETDFHPEDPRRIKEIWDELKAADLVPDPFRDPTPEDAYRLWHIAAREATKREISLVHKPEQYEWVESLPDKEDEELLRLAQRLDSVYLHKLTFMCAKLSAGGAIEACRAVVVGRVKNSVAIIRPPGHHAESDRPGGFCFFDNVCVAARVCQQDFPETCRKILILDWDVHHGNGVQEIFYNDPNVLYISLHVHRGGQFYPATQYGNEKHCGAGPGLGYNVNIPWPCHGMRDADYLFAFQRVVMPIAQEFDPDLVIVAAGFDAAEGDELGMCHVSPAGYAHMTHSLMSLARGKVAVCLEGGYNLRSIAKSCLAVTQTLMGEAPGRILDPTPSDPGVDTVNMVIRQQSKFWKGLTPPDSGAILKNSIPAVAAASNRLHDAIREWQAKVMWDEFKMRELPILRDELSKSFSNQVLATANYEHSGPVLVIFHDPPEVVGMPNARTNKLELHNTWLTDVSKSYIEWAIKQGFAVVDVNIPKFYTQEVDDGGYAANESPERRSQLTRELAHYLWENYLEPNEAHDLFILGIGDAYTGIIGLMNENERCIDSIDFIFSFVADNRLQSVGRNREGTPDWYHSHSMVFIADDHMVWTPEGQKKAKKKYGTIVRSQYTQLNDMLAEHKAAVCDKLYALTRGWREQQAAARSAQPSNRESVVNHGSNGTTHSRRQTPRLDPDMQSARVAMRGATPASPRSADLRSPQKLPPIGVFGSPAQASPRR